MDFDYKKHSLEQLKNWVRDALVTAEVSPQEIYDTIKGVVNEEYHYFKHHTGRCYDLLALLNGNGKGHIQGWDEWEKTYYPEESQKSCDRNDPSPECKKSWTSFWEETDDGMKPCGHSDLEYQIANSKKDKVKKWVLPVEETKISETDETEYFVSFPDDLLEAADLKESDQVEWVDNNDGSYTLRKITKPLGINEC
jgi:hypothetical protein